MCILHRAFLHIACNFVWKKSLEKVGGFLVSFWRVISLCFERQKIIINVNKTPLIDLSVDDCGGFVGFFSNY